MENIVKVSVIMPFLNSITYLKECMDSVVNQTLKEIEIICVDAGSTDGTLEMLQEYAKNDKRITILNSPMKSYGYQVNLGLRSAKGKYFSIVESDDCIKENMYEILYSIGDKYECDVIKADFYIFVCRNGKKCLTYRPLTNISELYNRIINPKEDLRIFRAYGINPPGIYSLNLIKKNHIKLNESPGASYQDNGLWFQIFSFAKSVYLYNDAFYMVRRDNPNSSVKNPAKVYCICDEYDYIRTFLSRHPEFEKVLAPICAYFRYGNYLFTLDRIADEFKLEFCRRFSQDFNKIKEEGELDVNLFSKRQWDKLMFIIKEPDKYYYTQVYKFDDSIIDLKEVIRQNIALNYKIDILENKINRITVNHKNKGKLDRLINYYKTYGIIKTMTKILDTLKRESRI